MGSAPIAPCKPSPHNSAAQNHSAALRPFRPACRLLLQGWAIPLSLQLATPAFARWRSAFGFQMPRHKTATARSQGASTMTTSNVETLPTTPKPQTTREVIQANVELLIEQLEAGHSEALPTTSPPWDRFTTTRSATSLRSHGRSPKPPAWLECTHGIS